MALDPFHPPSQDGHRVLIPEGRKTDGSMGKSFALTCKRSDTSSSLLASHLGWDRSCPSPEPQKTAQRSAQRCSVLFLLGLNHAGMGIGLLSHLSGFNTLISQTSLYFSVPRYHYLLPPALHSQNQHLLGHSKKHRPKNFTKGSPVTCFGPARHRVPSPRELTVLHEVQVAAARTLEADVRLAGLQLHEEAALRGAVEVIFAQPLASSDPLIFILGGKKHRGMP